jgi:hypothetical protein|tara:strand:- start:91 stop:219 length:129 start_codon:yes stop_codon:yes gene_type:complete
LLEVPATVIVMGFLSSAAVSRVAVAVAPEPPPPENVTVGAVT